MMIRLGDYIRPVDVRNRDLNVTRLVGLTIDKAFIPSVANTIGKDLLNYKVISENQFACDTVGGVLGNLEWADFCDMKIQVPAIENQRETVAEYNTLQKCIETNRKLIATLEQTAQTLYRHTFVDNIDPNHLPEGWRMGTLGNFYKFQYGNGNTNPDNGGPYPIYGSNGFIGGFDKYNNEDAPVIGHIGNCGSLNFAYGKHYFTYNGVMCLIQNTQWRYFGYLVLLSSNLKSQVRGSTQPFLSYDILYEINAIIPTNVVIEKWNDLFENMFKDVFVKQKENQTLT